MFHEKLKYFPNLKIAYSIDIVVSNNTQPYIYLIIICLFFFRFCSREWLVLGIFRGMMVNRKGPVFLPEINHEFSSFIRSLYWLSVVYLTSTLLDLTFHPWYPFSSLFLSHDDTLKSGIQRAVLYAPGNLSHSRRLGFVSETIRDHQELSFIDRMTVECEVIPTLMNMYWMHALCSLYNTSGLIKENWSTFPSSLYKHTIKPAYYTQNLLY
jgi:hypothetical protein